MPEPVVPEPVVPEPVVVVPAVSGSPRVAEFDVVRAVALLGVFTMNYVVFWRVEQLRGLGWSDERAPGWLVTVLHPWSGPLSTRFAATLVTLVGMGIALGARSAVAGGDPARISGQRWRLRRRGVLFILVGVMFDAVWSGEILHYVGTYLILAAWMITWSTRRLVAAAFGVVAFTAALRVCVFVVVDERSFSWWNGVNARSARRFPVGTPQGYLSSVLSWGGHPVLPWLTFVIVGMLLARWLVPEGVDHVSNRGRLRIVLGGVVLAGAGFAFAMIANVVVTDRWAWVASLDPVSLAGSPFGLGMPAYVLSVAGTAVVAITLISWLARRWEGLLPVRVLARAGRVTFTIYVLHGLVPWALTVHGIVGQGHGLYASLAIAFGAWSCAVTVGALYQRWRRIGPLEWLLRRIGG